MTDHAFHCRQPFIVSWELDSLTLYRMNSKMPPEVARPGSGLATNIYVLACPKPALVSLPFPDAAADLTMNTKLLILALAALVGSASAAHIRHRGRSLQQATPLKSIAVLATGGIFVRDASKWQQQTVHQTQCEIPAHLRPCGMHRLVRPLSARPVMLDALSFCVQTATVSLSLRMAFSATCQGEVLQDTQPVLCPALLHLPPAQAHELLMRPCSCADSPSP